MVDLITRDSVINIISQCHLHFPDRLKVFDRIYGLPAVDAVPLVRCKDCDFYNPLRECCMYHNADPYEMPGFDPDGFCSYGIRRDGGQQDG